ncbi:MAG: ABC transporter permease [Myxococcota bacterium]
MSQGSAVLWREAARTSRRWQTYALRAGFSGALLVLLLFGIWTTIAFQTSGWVELTEQQYMGRYLFISFTVIQMVIGLCMAPMMTSAAIVEERLEGTLDLLVLTPLTASSLLAAKVGSRLTSLLTVVLGSLPLMALVTTLGGVSITEVLLVTVGNAVCLVVMGVMGAFFGLFTKSPVIATLAAVGWAILAFLALPGLYALITASPASTAQVSPFFASAGTWSGLLLPLTYVPAVLLTWHLGTKLFQLKMANAELRRYFSEDVWRSKAMMITGGVFLVMCITVLPIGVIASWSLFFASQSGTPSTSVWIVGVIGIGLCWLCTHVLILLCTWFYLRLGMDLVDAFEGMLSQMGRDRARRRKSQGHKIWNNPVAWREARVSAWGRGGLPLMIGWGLALFAIAQSALWLIPGGLLTVGAANAAVALLLTVWLAAGSIEQERRGSTLDMVLVSRLSSTRIVWGKLFAMSLPTLPVMLLSLPLLFFGFPYLDSLSVSGRSDWTSVVAGSAVRGAMTGIWLLVFWLFTALASMWVALRVRNPGGAYGAAVSLIASLVLIPSFLTWVLRDAYWVSLPARLLMPVTAPSAMPWEILFSGVGLLVLSALLFLRLAARIRTWGRG